NISDELVLGVVSPVPNNQLDGQLALDQLVDPDKSVDSGGGGQRSPQFIGRQRVINDVLRSPVPQFTQQRLDLRLDIHRALLVRKSNNIRKKKIRQSETLAKDAS